jgi:molybdate ABC transporter permease protein
MPLFISLKVALIATVITFVLGVPIAYGMAHYRGRGQALIDSFLLLPLVLPPTVVGFLLLWLLGTRGPLMRLVAWLPGDLALPNIVFTWWAAVVTAVVVALPLMYRTGQAAFNQIDAQLPKVARTLGASEWRVFSEISLPLAAPGLVAATLLSFARALGEFGATLMLAGNIPGKTQTLPMAVYFAVEGGDFASAARWSAWIVAIALLTVLFANQVTHWPNLTRFFRYPVVQSQTVQNHIDQTFEQLPTASASLDSPTLSVDITKQLPNFTLSIKFDTADGLLSVLGESGAGKSLLLRCLAGVERPDAGRIILGGRTLYDSARGIDLASCDRTVALLFQNYALFPHLSVFENVAFGIPRQPRQSIQAKVTQELAAVQMERFAHSYPSQLSGGQQQRVALARALASQPRLLLLDEPFSALDTHLRSQLSQSLFHRLSSYSGTTLLVTHSLSEAYRAAQLLVIHRGQSLRQDRPAAVFEDPQSEAIAQLTGPINRSPAEFTAPDRCYAQRWQMHLQIQPPGIQPLSQKSATAASSIGIRPNHLRIRPSGMYRRHQTNLRTVVKMPEINDLEDLLTDPLPLPSHRQALNQALCWLADHWVVPGQVVVLIKLHASPHSRSDYHLQVTIPPPVWQRLQQHPLPWTVYLPAQHLIALWS